MRIQSGSSRDIDIEKLSSSNIWGSRHGIGTSYKNLAISAPKITGILIKPGETFSLWKLVGRISEKYGYKEDEEIKKAIEDLEKEFAGNGRVLIRPSGTEPLVRVMIEGENQDYISQKANEIAKLIEEKLK